MTTVRTVIKSLEACYDDEDEILIAWWDKSWFEQMLYRKISNDDWEDILGCCENVLEYTDLGDQLEIEAERALEELEKEKKRKKKKPKPTKKKPKPTKKKK
jgi:hypothetical protein